MLPGRFKRPKGRHQGDSGTISTACSRCSKKFQEDNPLPDIKDALKLELNPGTFPVEIAKIREFSTSLLDDSPAYRSSAKAKAAGFKDMPVPVTFLVANAYAEPGQNGLMAIMDAGIAKRGMMLHGEQEFEYLRPIYVGERLTVTNKIVDAYEKEGSRGGSMVFFVAESEFTGEDGKPAARTRMIIIERRPAPKAA